MECVTGAFQAMLRPMNTTLQEIATLVDGLVARGEPSLRLTGFNSISEAEEGDVTVLGNPRYGPALKKTRASAVLIDEQFADIPSHLGVIRVANPTLKFSLIIQQFEPPKRPFIPGAHPTAIIS